MIGGRGNAQCVGLLAVVAELGEPLLGCLGETQRAFGIAFLERDAGTQDVDDRAHADVARERCALAAAIDGFARGAHVAVFELDRGERLHDGKLDRGVGYALEQSERTLIVRDRAVELARVVQRDGYTHVALRGQPKLARPRRDRERQLVSGERLYGAMKSAVDGAEVDERPRAESRVGDLALLHDVARRLKRFGARRELAVL